MASVCHLEPGNRRNNFHSPLLNNPYPVCAFTFIIGFKQNSRSSRGTVGGSCPTSTSPATNGRCRQLNNVYQEL